MHRILQNPFDNISPMGCNLQFNSLSPLHQPTCSFCKQFGSLRCTQCKQIYYCSVDCQKKDWQMHSVVCKPTKQNTNKIEDHADSLEESNKKENISVNIKNIEEQGKKIMASDLNTLGFKKNMKIEGTITEFINPSEFYVQVSSPEVLSNISKLAMKLKDYRGVTQEYIPVKGEVGVAKYSVDQTWYRVLIKEVDMPNKSVEVLYIDYGNGEKIQLNKIKGLQKDILQFPPCAIRCSIANFPLDKKEWNINCRNVTAPVLIGKYCSLIIVDVLMDDMPYFAVEVVLSKSGERLHKIILEAIRDLNSKELNSNKETSTIENESVIEKKMEYKELDRIGCLIPKIVSVSIGDAFLGMVAHIQTPGDFFCQQIENGCKLSELQLSLREYCENTSVTSDFCPAIGDLCCARFTEDNQWYRASVLSYISEKTALVGYVDYGNFEVLHLSRLQPIVQKLMELPVQAIKCTLAGVKSVTGTWPTEATIIMKQLIQNKVVAIKVMDKKESTFVVEITNESVVPAINVSKYLLELGYAIEESPILLKELETSIETEQEIRGQKQERVNWSWVTLTADQVVNIMVCMLYNPSKFYCQLINKDDLNALKELNLSLAEYCEKTAPNISQVTKGEIYGAYFSGDGKWYRAIVKDVPSSDIIKVQFVDYGNCEEIALDKIRQISSTFLKLPFQGIKCWLSGVRPIGKKWSLEATAALQMFATGKKLQARVISLTADGAEMELSDSSSSISIISEILISKHLAFKKEVLSNQAILPGKLAASDFQAISTCIQWTMPTFSVGETLSVHVLDVRDPELLYVIPKEIKVDPQKLHKLMTELTDYCNAQNDCIFQPRIDEPCCAKFSGDDNWYRAVIIGINASHVKVANADCGKVEMLPFSRLLPITAPYLELPFQIFKCSLAGVIGLDGKWSVSATEKLKSLLINAVVIITVKGVTQSIYPVTIKKKSENSDLDIAEQLVIENLAKYTNSGNQCSKVAECCCTKLNKQVAKLEEVIYFLLKDRFGEDKIPEIIKNLEK